MGTGARTGNAEKRTAVRLQDERVWFGAHLGFDELYGVAGRVRSGMVQTELERLAQWIRDGELRMSLAVAAELGVELGNGSGLGLQDVGQRYGGGGPRSHSVRGGVGPAS